jgi:hypothetical protein
VIRYSLQKLVFTHFALSNYGGIYIFVAANVNLASGYVQNVFVLAYVQPGVTLITRLLMDGSMISMETVIMFL